MARLKDVAPALRSMGLREFITTIVHEVSKDQLSTQAAAVAYAWLFALLPFLLFVLTLFAYIPAKEKIDSKKLIEESVRKVMAHDAADTIVSNLEQLLNEPRSALLSFGLIATLWIASGGMSMTMTALDQAFDAKKTWPFYVQRPIAMLLTIIVVVLILIVLVLLPVGTAVERWLADQWHLPARSVLALKIARYFISFLLLNGILILLYTYATRVRRRFVFLSPGAVFTLLVWFGLQAGFRFYVDRFGRYQKTYGAVGGVAIVLLSFYLDALVLLIGAEINNLVDKQNEKAQKPAQGDTKNDSSKPVSG